MLQQLGEVVNAGAPQDVSNVLGRSCSRVALTKHMCKYTLKFGDGPSNIDSVEPVLHHACKDYNFHPWC